jgi:hypothetical protein
MVRGFHICSLPFQPKSSGESSFSFMQVRISNDGVVALQLKWLRPLTPTRNENENALI